MTISNKIKRKFYFYRLRQYINLINDERIKLSKNIFEYYLAKARKYEAKIKKINNQL